MDFWNLFLQEFLEAAMPVVVVGVLIALGVVANIVWNRFKKKNPQLAWALEEAAGMAVRAAEQAGAAKLIEEKKKYAIGVVEKQLAAQGIKVDLDLVDAAVEAAVWDYLNKDKAKPAPTEPPTDITE